MKIGLLEHHQDPSETPRIITAAKARRLVHEFKIAVHLTPHLVRLTVKKSWATVKSWLRGTWADVQTANQAVDAQVEKAQQFQSRILHPHGARLNFGRWPSADQRTL